MTVDFPHPTNTHLPPSIISSVLGTRHYLSSLTLSTQIGITPYIGYNPDTKETLTLPDAFELVKWARDKEYVAEISYWSVNRDHGGEGGEWGRAGWDGVCAGFCGF